MTYQEQQLALVANIPTVVEYTVSEDTLEALTDAFTEYNVNVDIVNSFAGSRVETVALKTRKGERLKNLRVALPDIALRIGAPGIRLNPRFTERQITIEIPRKTPSNVSLSDVLFTDAESTIPTQHTAVLPWAVGLSATGERIIADLAQAPHLLISGATGSGKSAALEALIMGLAITVGPDDLEFILVDPKRVDLTPFADLPHVRREVVTDPATAELLFVYLREVMAARYRAFQDAGVSDITAYKAAGKLMRRIVVVVDELADLVMAPNGKAIETHLIALAQMARAAGIHLVAATQRPSAAVLSTQLRSQLPTRLAFAVASAIDSRVALDESGAEALTGKGDALLKMAGGSAVRLQGVYLTADWIAWLVWQTANTTCAGRVQETKILFAAPAEPEWSIPATYTLVTVPPTAEELMRKGALAYWLMNRLGSWGWLVPVFFMRGE
jgi:S-DNA-T family DNA segregation ATPase FtsK/SpoIIIE